MATDNFNRADGALGANWTTHTGTFSILSNQAQGTAAGTIAWAGAGSPFSANHYSEIKAITTGKYYGPAVNVSAGGNAVGWHQLGHIHLLIDGVLTFQFGTLAGFTLNDVVSLTREGMYVVAHKNGTLVGGIYVPYLVGTGQPGVWAREVTSTFDDWAGGEYPFTGTSFARMTRQSLNISQTSDADSFVRMTRQSLNISQTSNAAANARLTRVSINVSVTVSTGIPVTGAFISSTAVLYPPSLGYYQNAVGAFIGSTAVLYPPSVAGSGIGLPYLANVNLLYPPTLVFSGPAAIGMPFIDSTVLIYPPDVEASWVDEPAEVFNADRDLRQRSIGILWIEAYLPD